MFCLPRRQPALARWLTAIVLSAAFSLASACPESPGPTCNIGASAPASQPLGVSVNLGAGNPINVINGNKYQREVDMPALPGVMGLEIVRHYNSMHSGRDSWSGRIGRGWRLSYETRLAVTPRSIEVLQADGASVVFARDALKPSVASTDNPARGVMQVRRGGRGDEYLWRWADGRELSFNHLGQLVQIKAASGEITSLLYDPRGPLVRVTDPQGRSLQLHYLDRDSAIRGDRYRGIQSIDTPVGRFSYEYGSAPPAGSKAAPRELLANLVRVRYPAVGQGRQYHYEDARQPTLLTGISIDQQQRSERYATFGYNADGKGVLSTHAGNVDKVTLDYTRPGLTTITNSLGQKTTYRYAGAADDWHLVEVRGAGCALCGTPNQRYGYDAQGRLTEVTQLTASGQPIDTVRNQLDEAGRVVRTERISYRAGAQPQQRWLARYEYAYAAAPGPSLIARPSVVAEREMVTRLRYNSAGQVLSVSEHGWAPPLQAGAAAQPIERQQRFVYRLINGRSVLTQIDGPLPNGRSATPADSDITQIAWDANGATISAITAPGGITSRLDYDSAGRVAAVRDNLGALTSYRYDFQQRVLDVSVDGVTRHTRYDGAGQPLERGYTRNGRYHAVTRSGYDAAGRNVWNASALGVLQRLSFDTEGQLLETVRQTGSQRQVRSMRYDAAGRLSTLADNAGGAQRIVWNEQNLPDVLIDESGQQQYYAYDAGGALSALQDSDGSTQLARDAHGAVSAVTAPNGVSTRYLTDDFGQQLAVISADSGVRSRVYDAAGRVVASTDALGNRGSYAYDPAGRIVRQTISSAAGGPPLVTEWQYQGRQLVQLRHTHQSEAYAYDAQQRLVARTVTLRDGGGREVTTRIRYGYDAEGQLSSYSLADGSTILYQRNGQGQITGMVRQRLQSPWLQWLAPQQVIVRGMERDLMGLRRMVYGNGVEALRQRSAQGVLARLAYRRSAPPQSASVAATLARWLPFTPANAAELPALPGALGWPADRQALLDHRYLWDGNGNLLQTQDVAGASNYAYDGKDRLIAAVQPLPVPVSQSGGARHASAELSAFARYHYDAVGNRVLAQEQLGRRATVEAPTQRTSYQPGSNRRARVSPASGAAQDGTLRQYDGAGQPAAIGDRQLVWNALGQLVAVRAARRELASYGYNHRGQRVSKAVAGGVTLYLYEGGQLAAELAADGTPRRQYLYLAGQPVALLDTAPDGSGVADSWWMRLRADLAELWRGGREDHAALRFIHTNHLGAPELVTDGGGAVLWQGSYLPFGQLLAAPGSSFQLALRLPGQYEDAETGLYYNEQRYYDPAQGAYLTPDPLGLRAGINQYAYVSGNPLKYVDPQGLVLFAFDGTGNDESDPATLSNVVRFRDLYQQRKFYMTGPGTRDPATGIENSWWKGGNLADTAGSLTGKERIGAMIGYLDSYAEEIQDDTAIDIDITGFSRGSAQARDFANQIVKQTSNGYYHYKNAAGKDACQKVNFRFMGIFDTVLSTHFGDYDLSVPDAFKQVSHATALNEYRGALIAFPLESILNNPDESKDGRIEKSFLGAHSDIGGGFPEQDLARVALAWMVKQAQDAGLQMSEPAHRMIGNPVLHDKSANLLNGAPDGGPTETSEDRDVRYRNGSVVKQRKQVSGGMTYADTVKYIKYLPNPTSGNGIAGTVDAAGYLAWLNQHNYNINMSVE